MTKKHLLWTLAVSLTACALASGGARLSAASSDDHELVLSVDPALHQRFGLAYPITYIINLTDDDAGLLAWVRYDSVSAWAPLTEHNAGEFFNGIDAVRFDHGARIAYVSATLSAASDDLHIRITTGGGTPLPITYGGVAKYYDNRNAAVVISIDDWKQYTDTTFARIIPLIRSHNLPFTAGVITGDWSDSTYAHIQAELNAGGMEAAPHTRDHERWPYADVEYQVGGSRLDMFEHLTMPAQYRRGSTQYIYSFIVPYGETSAEIETVVTHSGYLIDRVVGAQTGKYTAWDTTMGRFPYDGTTREMGSPWGSIDAADLNASFDQRLAQGRIYHLLMHPHSLVTSGEIYQPFFTDHLTYISNRPDIWYVTFGHLYVYRLLGDTAVGHTVWPETPPIVTVDPQSQTIIDSTAVAFSCVASGSPPLTFQWQKNGIDIPGATTSTFPIAMVTMVDSASTYRCIVANAHGADTSASAILTVISESSGGGIVSDDFNATAMNTSLWQVINPLHDAEIAITGGGTNDADLAITLPGGVIHDAWTDGATAPRIMQSAANADLSIEAKFDAAMTASSEIQGLLVEQDSLNFIRFDFIYDQSVLSVYGATFVSGEPTEQVSLEVSLYAPYYLRLRRAGNTWSGYFSQDGISWTLATTFVHELTVRKVGTWVGNAGESAPAFTGLIDYFFNTYSPTIGEDGPDVRVPPTITADPVGLTRYEGASATFTVAATGTTPFAYRWQRNGSDIPGMSAATLSLVSVARSDSGAGFRCIVSNMVGQDTSMTAVLRVLPLFPAMISVEPPDSTVYAGRPVSFSVRATGTAPLTYGWQKNGTDIQNATDSVLAIAVAFRSDSGSVFRCIVSNAGGKDTSRSALLRVVGLDTATITREPLDTTVYTGLPAHFHVAATGTVPLTFQWQKNGSDLPSATDSLLTLAPVVQADSGAGFRCIVANPGGRDTSKTAILHVMRLDTAKIVREPTDTLVYAGTFARFSVGAAGTLPLTFRWLRNEAAIAGAVDSIFQIDAVAQTDSGAGFRCIVTNPGGSDTSAPAMLHVRQLPAPPAGIRVDLHVFLQGAMDGDSMRTALRGDSLLPLMHPFAALGWITDGVDSVGSLPTGIVDWVLVEFRYGPTDSSVCARRAALLWANGTVTDLDGVSPVACPMLPAGSYFVVVRHRNHLPIMTASAIMLDSTVTTFDFRSAASRYYGGDAAVLAGGKYGMVAGNADHNRGIGATDLARIRLGIAAGTWYNDADVDLSGTITATDIAMARGNIGRMTRVP